MHTKRVRFIDALRGLSLLGILLANLLIFHYGIWGKDEISYFSLSDTDRGLYSFLKIVVEGSFMPIFTFLFGYSLVILAESIKNKNGKVKRHLWRRFLLLFSLGLLHATYLWEGDILAFYGMMGIFLLLFLNRRKKTLIIWGMVLFILTGALGYGVVEETIEEEKRLSDYIEKTYDIYKSGSYEEIKDHRNNESPLFTDDELETAFLILFMLLFAPLLTSPMFLFGMAAAKGKLFQKMEQEEKWYKLSMALLPIGLLLKSVAILGDESNWTGIFQHLGAQFLSIAYIGTFAFLFRKFSASKVFLGLESAGKLSLTNYISQSVVCTFVFYGYGLGQFGTLGMLNSIFLVFILFVFQCISSYFYLKRFKRGPLEMIIRMGTNLSWRGNLKAKKQKIKVEKVLE
ncbi:DUF418 domain-containing protein [uncultured Psychrobacillus sp.]|uniref:DUF418 domain-containing protein n=1 Tax=uncultured Psychrobacillus sp. TaxID=1551585 RepID=UPI002613810C|nr:DUF418 domain-containing protein [uncultured Psychrobacillus sp.]